jgi:hypothetical protein
MVAALQAVKKATIYMITRLRSDPGYLNPSPVGIITSVSAETD